MQTQTHASLFGQIACLPQLRTVQVQRLFMLEAERPALRTRSMQPEIQRVESGPDEFPCPDGNRISRLRASSL